MKKTPLPMAASVLRNIPLQAEAHVLSFARATPTMPTAAAIPLQPPTASTSALAPEISIPSPLRPALHKPPLSVPQASTPVPTQAPTSTPTATRSEALAEQRYQDGLHAGREQGFEAGYAKALKETQACQATAKKELEQHSAAARQALTDLQAATFRLDALATSLQQAAQEQLCLAEEDQLTLCYSVVARALGETATKPEALLALVRETALQMRQRPLAAVHVHPDDLDLLKQLPETVARLEAQWQPINSNAASDETNLAGGSPASVVWVADPEVRLGGCIVASPEGGLDARLEVQLQKLRQALLQARVERTASGSL